MQLLDVVEVIRNLLLWLAQPNDDSSCDSSSYCKESYKEQEQHKKHVCNTE